MQVIVIASQKMHHCLSPFMHLWHKYAGFGHFDVTVLVPSEVVEKGFQYSRRCRVRSVGPQSDWPVSEWSSKLGYILDSFADEQFILMLEDYWILRPVDVMGVKMLFDYAKQFENVLKIDLGFDRLYINGGQNFLYNANTYDHCGYLDLLKSPHGSPYQMSLWGGIWNREQMKRVLIPGEKPQDIEIGGSSRVAEDQLVLGTRQGPLLHGNIYQSRNEARPVYEDANWAINPDDLKIMEAEGWI